MSFKSKNFYMKVKGEYALFTTPTSKGGGEKISYQIPTREALKGMVDAVYFKPVFKNIVEEVRIMKPIRTQTTGIRALLKSGNADLNYFTYLVDVEYFVKYHFEWDMERPDLEKDRNIRKHEEIMERSLKKGGRRDVFLGTRECLAYVEHLSEDEYENKAGFYDSQSMAFGIMFHSFIYPTKPWGILISCYTDTQMINGRVGFRSSEECEIKNELSDYYFKYPKEIKSIEEELKEYKEVRD